MDDNLNVDLATDTTDNPRAVAGDNSYRDTFSAFNERLPGYLTDEHGAFTARGQELKDEFDRFPSGIDDDDTERRATDLGVRLKRFINDVAAQKKVDKSPVQRAAGIVDDFFTKLDGLVSPSMALLAKRVNAYKDAKMAAERARVAEEQRKAREAEAEARRLREEAERLERERAAAAAEPTTDPDKAEELKQAHAATVTAAAKAAVDARAAEKEARPAFVPTARTDSGAKSTQALRWVGDIVDFDAMDLNQLKPFLKKELFEPAVNKHAVLHKDTKPLQGVVFREKSATSFRA